MEAITKSEPVYLAAGKKVLARAEAFAAQQKEKYREAIACGRHFPVTVFEAETDDAWARDMAPTFVKKGGSVRAVNWSFNAWGGTVDGLYASWKLDDAFARDFAKREGYFCYDAAPFVLEGGSIHSDGEGTLIVTEACLLSQGRNPQMSREQIEEQLKYWLGVHKIIWLPCGIYQDETNEHVDNVCAFVRPGEVVLAWTEDETDPQYAMSLADLKVLEQETDAKGRKFKIHKLPIPQKPVCLTQEDVDGFVFEEGEDEREAGERMAVSYTHLTLPTKA